MSDSHARAVKLYDEAGAERYRRHDDRFADQKATLALAEWLSDISARCGSDLTVLDLGCGTGRFFWALKHVRLLVGVDGSPAMLAQARMPFGTEHMGAGRIVLVEADLLRCAFRDRAFDFVYAIGVLAEHAPLTASLVRDVAGWLRPGGRFAFTAVRLDSPTVPQTRARRAASRAMRLLPAAARGPIRRRLLSGGRYADDAMIRELLEPAFEIEALDGIVSDVGHLHARVVARRRAA
jgi:SAM-dependent methyltransferase